MALTVEIFVRWDTWGRLMEQTFAQLPLMVLPGNHEIDYDAQTSLPFGPYRHRFRMPSKLPEKIGPLGPTQDFLYEGGSSYYSFSMGLLHVVMLNNYNTHGARRDVATDAQKVFLETDLAKVDRETTPFVIVCMHNPLYNSNVGHHLEEPTHLLKKWAEPLFIQYGVDAVFAGHVHAYERNGGIAYGKPSATGPTYITVGNGGNHEGLYDEWLPKPPYSVFRDGRYYGHGELTVYNRTHLKWTWTPNPEQGDNLPSDSVWIRAGTAPKATNQSSGPAPKAPTNPSSVPQPQQQQHKEKKQNKAQQLQQQQQKQPEVAGVKGLMVMVGILSALASMGLVMAVTFRRYYMPAHANAVSMDEPLLLSTSV